MNQEKLSRVFAEIQRWRMTALAVSADGEIISAIGYDGSLKDLPRTEEILAAHPDAVIKHIGRSQVRSASDLVELVRGLVPTAMC